MEDVVSGIGWAESYSGRRVLITGHTGFKGTWLALWLHRLGADVIGFAESVPTQPNHFEALRLGIIDKRGDIADGAAIADAVKVARPEIVFHLAAESLVRRAYSDPSRTYRTNVLGSLNVYEACRREGGVRALVSATTDKVYRNREWEWGYREIDDLGGSDPYSGSKSCVELMTSSYRESFLRGEGRMSLATVRAGNVLGGGDWAEDRLLPDIVQAAFGGKPVRIRNPESTRPWQHVLDVLAGYLMVGARLLNGNADAEESWNFGPLTKASIRVIDVVAAVRKQFPDLQVEIQPESQGRHESGLLQLDPAKAVARLGWRPRWEDEMLERSLAWYRAFYQDGQLISEAQLDDYEAVND